MHTGKCTDVFIHYIYMLNRFLHVITHLVKGFQIWHHIFRFSLMFFIQCRHSIIFYILKWKCILVFSPSAHNLTVRLKMCSTCVISVLAWMSNEFPGSGTVAPFLRCCLTALVFVFFYFIFLSFILLCFVLFPYSRHMQVKGWTRDSKFPRGMNVSVHDCLSVSFVMGGLVRVFNGFHPSYAGLAAGPCNSENHKTGWMCRADTGKTN